MRVIYARICWALLCGLLLTPVSLFAQASKTIVVITAASGDYLFACAGTLAKFIDEGYNVYVVQIGNDEKNSIGLNPAETRLANIEEAENAARMLGIREVFRIDDKSGELGQISSNEMRNHMSIMIRLWKPEKVFIPDPDIHYEPDWDQFWVARAAEETNYTNSGYFLPEATRAGLTGHSPRETYYYAAYRPYRPGEGGHKAAKFMPVDITKTFNRKVTAIQALQTANHRYAVHVKQRLEAAGRPSRLLPEVNLAAANALIRAYVEELAETVGQKHGFTYGEEFNYHGRGDPVPPHVRERAKPIP